MKSIFTTLLLLLFLFVNAQHNIVTTESFVVKGAVQKELTVTISALKQYTTTKLDSIVITNHLKEKKSVMKNVKLVALKDVLQQLVLSETNPKLHSEYYFTMIAADGYKVVFSWNELFNTSVGNNVFIIVESNGKSITESDSRIALISPADEATGRRYVKGLQQVIVSRVQ
ncbi:MAG: molybdopterin-binding protein [Chitinophagaceae bacterium]|nr:molybdopterin-binding protein [Chitinophagaceae bacterium]